ncbi:SusD/RagB family nutrient-binding outer membrane lipoprotein [Bacteroides sp. OttesenSCG-928-M17]|nr:SusD/RagB family nutrient-binding outer membrane lipoprotein [Bacteroides sp. OttesenSCG-928-M17]
MKIYILFICLFVLASCTDDFQKHNTNEHEATEEMLSYDNLKIGGFFPQMQRDVIPVSDEGANDYQRAQNLTGDIYSGYMGAIGMWNSGSNNTTYNLLFDTWNDVAFNVAFTKVMSAWKQIVNLVEDEENSITYALAQVLKVAAMHRITDNYGPIPYLKFGHGGITTPYDSQEEVYKSFFAELNEAIEIITDFLEKNPTARPLKKFDMVYEGNFSKWLLFANSLKLRLAMRTVYVTPDLAKQYAEEAVASGVLENNSDNANLTSTNGIAVYHPLKKCWDDYSDTRMGANMESFLKGYNDNRIGKYFREATIDENGGYYGVRTGIRITNKDNYLPLSVPNIEANTPVQWMCAAEVYFLRAEGAIRGWNMKGSAKELYEKGITTSFQQWKVEVDEYLSDNTSKPAAYIDQVASNSIHLGDKRLSTITIAWDEKADMEQKLERIITQKWIAMFPDGQEAWTEFRRTGYPKIFPVAVNNSANTINTDVQIRRITFPKSEYNNNEVEVKKAVSLLGGADTGGTKLWWDKK